MDAKSSNSESASAKDAADGGGTVQLTILSDPNYAKLLKEGFDEARILKGLISPSHRLRLGPDQCVCMRREN